MEDLVEKKGFREIEAKRLLAIFYLYWAYLLEGWITGDLYNKTLKEILGVKALTMKCA